MKKFEWTRLAVIFAIVTIAISQIAFNLVLRNVRGTPTHWLFFFWTILWFQIIPFIIFLCVDALLVNERIQTRTARLWRALIYIFLFLSFLRQLQMSNAQLFHRLTWFVNPLIIYIALAIIVFIISVRFPQPLTIFVSYLAVLAGILTLLFLWRCFQPGLPQDSAQSPDRTLQGEPHPILFLIFDELSLQHIMKNGEINRELFPNFASLASDSIWFQNAMTNHFETAEALPSILTGHIYPKAGVPNIFELLGTKYQINVMETEMGFESDLCRSRKWKGDCRSAGTIVAKNPMYSFVFIRDIAYGYFLEGGLEKNVLFTPDYHMTLTDEMAYVLQNISANTSQCIYWHISIPHSPFIFDHDGRLTNGGSNYFPIPGTPLRVSYREAVVKYIEQARFADLILGKILNQLKSKNSYENSVIFVTSDHGLRVWNDLYNHVDETARVPVFLHAPGLAPAKSSIDFQLIDIVPTLLAILGDNAEANDFDGVSAFSANRPQRNRVFHFYLQDYSWNNSTNSWDAISKKKEDSSTKQLSFGMKVERSFSAVQVENDLGTSLERHVDFLTTYLSTHFPVSVNTGQMHMLQKNLAAISNIPSNALSYKKGMHYFFLALGGTSRIADNQSDDPKIVDHWWRQSLKSFQDSKDVGIRMTKELEEIISNADANNNDSLEREELISVITSRLKTVE